MKGVLAGKLIVKQQPNILEEFMYEEKNDNYPKAWELGDLTEKIEKKL